MDKSIIIAGALIGLGVAVGGTNLGLCYRQVVNNNNVVVVKGLAEKDVKADLALWTIKFVATNNNILIATKDIENQQKLIIEYLKNAGFEESEIIIQGLTMQDAYADSYRDKDSITSRYTLNQCLSIRSTKIDLVHDTFPKIGDLVSKGVSFSSYGNGVAYSFTKLNDIKPEMLKNAIENAKASANEFAINSGAKIGSIKRANQGVFSITSREQTNESDEASQIDKKVRVVSTIEYFIK